MKTKRISYNLIGCLAAGGLAMIACVVSWRLWEIDWSVLPGTDIDNLLCAFIFKSVHEYGLRGTIANYMVGAPGYSALIDIPMMDTIQLVLAYVIDLFTGDYVKTIYVFYLLTFATAAVTMYILLARFHIKWWVNTTASVIFAVAPFHFYREIIHLSLSNYMAVPIGVYLAYVILEDKLLFLRRENGKIKIVWKDLAVLAAAVFVGIGQIYYAFFIAIIMVIALIVRMIWDKSWKPLICQGLVLYAVCAAVIAGLVPKLLFGVLYGENTEAGIRVAYESELYGMKLIQLLMPSSFTRIPGLAKVNEAYVYSGVANNESMWAPLGIVASAAFLGLCGWLIYSYVVKKESDIFTKRLDFAALATLVIVLFCTVGGFGAIFNYIVTPQIRCYNRASILIVCLVLLVGALTVNRIKKTTVSAVLCAGLLVIAYYDQVPILESGWQDEMAILQGQYEEFFEDVEESLPESAMVYQLPYTDFPEVPPLYRMTDYSSFVGYLFTDNVHWSYGGVKGRNPEAEWLHVDAGMSDAFVEGILDAGFSGVLIDTYGYGDGGAAVLEFYRAQGYEEMITENQRYEFFVIGDSE